MRVIMIGGHATIDTAVEAIKTGASASLKKPITLKKLLKAVEQGFARVAWSSPVKVHRPPPASR